jgi:hypothetical protein
MSRTGAFFVLPALAVWCARRLLPDDAGWRLRLRFFTVAIAAAFAGFCVSQVLSYLTASGATFSDYPPIAYGLMHHEDFTYLAATHPQLASLTGNARAHEAWRIVMDEAAGRPLLLLGGLARSLAELFASPAGLFGFVFRNPDDIVLENVAALHASLATYGILGPFQLLYKTLGLYSLLNFVAMAVLAAAFAVAAVAGMVALYRRRTDAYATMLGYAVIGALASAPFMPPWITSSHQTQTATLAFLAVVPGIMFAAGPVAPQPATRSRGLLLVPAAVAALVILAAALLRAAPERAPVCGTTNDHAVRLYPSTAVTVARERSLSFGNKAAEDLRFSILYLKRHNQAFTASVTPFLKEGTLHVAAYDACDNTVKILIDDTHALDLANRGWQHVSVHPLAAPDVLHVAGRANGR